MFLLLFYNRNENEKKGKNCTIKREEKKLHDEGGEDCCQKGSDYGVCAYIIEFKEPYLSYKFVVQSREL